MPKFDDALVENFAFTLAVRAKYIEDLGNGRHSQPDSLLLLDRTGKIIAVGDFFPANQVASLEPLDVLRERAEQAFLDGVMKGANKAYDEEEIAPGVVTVRERDLTPEEFKALLRRR